MNGILDGKIRREKIELVRRERIQERPGVRMNDWHAYGGFSRIGLQLDAMEAETDMY